MSFKVIVILACLLNLFSYGVVASAGPLVIGRVSTSPSKAYEEVKPILDYVVTHLRDVGVTDGLVVVAKNRPEMLKFLNEGKVDWTTDSVISSLIYSEMGGADILLRRWSGGMPTYYSVIFTRKDSGIDKLEDLRGKKIAYENPGSTTSFYIPMATIMKAGIELTEISSPKAIGSANKINYAFAGDELNITTWVHRRVVDAGAYHNQNWEASDTNPDAMKQDLRIFYQSRPFPRMTEVVRKGLDPKIKKRLRDVLLMAHEDPAAKAALMAYHETTKFDEFKGAALMELQEARVLFKFLAGKVIPGIVIPGPQTGLTHGRSAHPGN